MAQDVPMMVEEVMLGFTISRLRAYLVARACGTDQIGRSLPLNGTQDRLSRCEDAI